MPQEGPWESLRDHLVERIPLPPNEIDAMMAAGEFAGPDGRPVAPDAPFVPRSVVWVHRAPTPEVPVPFDLAVIHQDERIVVVDKPPFLSTMPRGRHIRETVVTRMRVALGLPQLTPAHRLDRMTSGVLVLTTEQRWRGAYQQVFARRSGLVKDYLACAPIRADLTRPTTVQLHLSKPRGQLQSSVLEGMPANSITEVTLIETRGSLGLYRLRPVTGRTHQLRVVMSWLGVPIAGDPLYPEVLDVADDDFDTPLGLVAARLRFADPVDERRLDFRSPRMPWPWPSDAAPSLLDRAPPEGPI